MKFRKISAGLVFISITMGGLGCLQNTATNTPEAALQRYVSLAFSVRDVGDKKKLLEMSSGEAFEQLRMMPDDAFKAQFVDTKLSLVSLKTRDLRQEAGTDMSLVYELEYKEGAVNPAVMSNRKVAFLTKDDHGQWKIRATKNLKSTIEQKQDLVISP